MQMAGFLTQDKTSREEWTVAESGAQDALVVSSKKEIGCGERDEQVQGQRSTARSSGAGRLNDHRTDRTGATRVPYQCRCWCTAVSVLFCKEKMILATADTRTTREQMIPKSKQSNITHFCINVPHRTQPSTHPLPVPSSQQGLLEAKNCSSPVSLRPQITLGFHPYYSLANLRISVDFEDSSASLVGCFDLIGLAQGLTDSPELSHYPWLQILQVIGGSTVAEAGTRPVQAIFGFGGFWPRSALWAW
ncbi:hypothetical protein BGZ57DRAFT_852821 [Hyaloscypha finlandica]|nr:hypothetical protein BGZ57DRAFT_852821 [Hyaloscypha finlandica]